MKMKAHELADFLFMVSEEVRRGGSDEGNIEWSFGQVRAFVRNGNDQGQGGAWHIPHDDVTEPSHPAQEERA